MIPLLVITCDDCCACCMREGMPPSYEDFSRRPSDLPDDLHVQLDNLSSNKVYLTRGVPCAWLDIKNKRCVNYYFRPKECRDFEIGGQSCMRARDV